MLYQSLQFWTLLVGIVAFVLRYYLPAFPLSEEAILSLVLFVLGLIGVVPQFRAKAAIPGIFNSLAFWQLVAGFVSFIITFFAPSFPFGFEAILALFLFVLGFFGVYPELRARGLRK